MLKNRVGAAVPRTFVRQFTFTLKGWQPVSKTDMERRQVVYPSLNTKGALDKWHNTTPVIDAELRTERKKQCVALTKQGITPAIVFNDKLGVKEMIKLPASRIRHFLDHEGFIGRDYAVRFNGRTVRARPHHVHF
eukprot:TRINITY_DN2052_c0_g1_i2.p2 TRINITY_DN2052_c0_g1~~TRINITY_DN2052_c0_g1_i2.p2  ORF type:complete len:150 (-),score=12.92 TRINITY_DN2052_c0_g1_i2:42-446(-)